MKLKIFIIFITIASQCLAQPAFKMQSYSDQNYPELTFNYLFIPEKVNINYQPKVQILEDGIICKNEITKTTFPSETLRFHFFMNSKTASFKERDLLIEYGKQLANINEIQIKPWFNAILRDSLMISLPLSNDLESTLDSLNFNLTISDIIDFYQRSKGDFNENDVLFFYINKATYEEFKLLSINFPSQGSLNSPLIILIYNDIKPPKGEYITNSQAFPFLIIEKNDFDANIRDNLINFLSSWIYRYFETTFHVPDELKLTNQRTYTINIDDSIKGYSYETPVFFKKDQIGEHFKLITLREGQKLIEEGNYVEQIKLFRSRGMDYLDAGYSDSFFSDKGYETIMDYGFKLSDQKNTNAFELFKDAESIFGPSYTSNYREQKIEIIEQFYDNLDGVNGFEDKSIIIADTLLNLDNSKENLYRQNKSRGDKNRSIKKYWEAADYYSKAKVIKPSKHINELINQTISEAVEQSANNKEWEVLYDKGTKYKSIIYTEFKLRLLYANACLESNQFKVAFDEFDWLLANWQDQSIMDWTTAFNNLRITLSSTSNYDRALAISRQLFVDKNTVIDGQSNIGLHLYLLNARAKFYQPLADLASLVLSSDANIKVRNLGEPDELSYMGIVDRSLNPVKQIINNEKPMIQPSDILNAKTFPFFISNQDASYGWIVNKVQNNYFIIQINNRKISMEEKILLDRITASPTMGQNWNTLFKIQQTKGLTFTSKALTAFIETGISRKVSLSNIWNRLKNQSYIKYMIHHPPGRQEVTFGTPPDISNYGQGERSKSASTIAYYELSITNGNLIVRDISNPLLINGKYEGVIRLGFEN